MNPTTTSRIGAVILAAGTSSRMGEAKQLLRLGGSTLLDQVVHNLCGSRVAEIVIVLGHEAETIKQQTAVKNLKVVVNESYRQGMGTSLRAGLSALSSDVDAALIVLADQPFVRPATFDQIIEHYRQSQAQIVIPIYKGFRGNPVLLDRSVFPEVMALTGDIGCRAIFGNDLEGREIAGDGQASQGSEVTIVGRDPVAIALAKIAKLLRFRVTVVDPFLKSSDLPDADRFLNSLDFSKLPAESTRYVVVASRGQFDEEAVEQALHSNSAYIALVANKKRAQEIRRSLELKGAPAEKLAKVHAPAGLSIGAETPEEIALSIMAEIVSEIRRSGGSKSEPGS